MVVYWSQTGGTEAMVDAVMEGIRKVGEDALVTGVFNIPVDALKDTGIFALGCPATEAGVLKGSEMDPFAVEAGMFASGRHIGLFGSYGWGGGGWVHGWQARIINAGADIVGGEGVIAQESPGEGALSHCREPRETLATVEV